jgi:hypothetical protein
MLLWWALFCMIFVLDTMKKILSLCLCAVAVLSMTACHQKTVKPEPIPQVTTPRVAKPAVVYRNPKPKPVVKSTSKYRPTPAKVARVPSYSKPKVVAKVKKPKRKVKTKTKKKVNKTVAKKEASVVAKTKTQASATQNKVEKVAPVEIILGEPEVEKPDTAPTP